MGGTPLPWLDLITLIGAIALIVLIVQLRQIAALPFVRVRARFVPVAAPPALADLHAQAEPELALLGFDRGRWVHLSAPDASIAPLRAVHVHASGAALWLFPPNLIAPNRLSGFFVSRLIDGRMLITQPFDCFFEVYAIDNAIVQSIGAPSYAEQWAAHQALVVTHGQSDPEGITEDALLAFNNHWMEGQRLALIARGALAPTSADSARPTLGFAWSVLRAMRRMPKPPVSTEPVPPARIALLATQFERMRERSPARSVELTLFAFSVALFMVLGAVLWDLATAWMILVVIVIHELGHFLAMRAFGYRNVHMMALPLVGGVAIGQEVNPSAHRSAWMSLMGPLPGIAIGWGILIAAWTGLWPEDTGDPMSWAIMFLLINYLNVLPVPPLDGGHVVQALLPARRAWLEVGFIAIACTIGAWLAWQLDFVLLAIIALLQLLTLGGRLQAQRALAHLAAQPPALSLARPLRLKAVSDTLQAMLGPAKIGKERVAQVLDVLQRLDRRPMRWWQTLGVGLTYGALLVVPVAGVLASFALKDNIAAYDSPEAQAAAADMQAANERIEAATKGKSTDQLLADVIAAADWAPAPPAGVSESQLQAAAERTGAPLPESLAQLYRAHDGIEALGIDPIDQLRVVRTHLDEWFAIWESPTLDVELVGVDDGPTQKVEIAALRHWLQIGGSEDGEPLLFNPGLPGGPIQILEMGGDWPTGYRNVREWLESRWIGEQQSLLYQQAVSQRQAVAQGKLKDADWPKLLSTLQPGVPFPYSLLAAVPALPEPASDAAIRAAEQRMGAALPDGLAAVLKLQNGVPALQLGSVEGIRLLDVQSLKDNPWLQDGPGMLQSLTGAERLVLGSVAELQGCWDLDGKSSELPSLLIYCPSGHRHAGVIDLRTRNRHPDLRSFAIARAAQIQAASQPF